MDAPAPDAAALAALDTPAVLVDLDVAERNVDRFQAYADAHGLVARPHVKTHKLPSLARRQLAAGAVGITCQKVSEAEAMVAAGGVDDVLLTYNVVGEAKLTRLVRLARRVRLAVTADHPAVVDGLSDAFRDEVPLRVLVECDTGAARCGVVSPEQAVDLARCIDAAPGLAFGGLMTYPRAGGPQSAQAFLAAAKAGCEAAGLAVEVVTSGGSPDMWRAHTAPVVTEYRPGTYVYMDRSLVRDGVCGFEDCALTVLATVVSTPTPERAVVDAGSKTLTSDTRGLEGFGHVLGRFDLAIDQLSEEHGRVTAGGEATGLRVGERVRIVPNHACVVSNLFDAVTTLRGGEITGSVAVAARGRVW
jgi:D-serine deaminase-like pyridoxal phosphate-dependent protein